MAVGPRQPVACRPVCHCVMVWKHHGDAGSSTPGLSASLLKVSTIAPTGSLLWSQKQPDQMEMAEQTVSCANELDSLSGSTSASSHLGLRSSVEVQPQVEHQRPTWIKCPVTPTGNFLHRQSAQILRQEPGGDGQAAVNEL